MDNATLRSPSNFDGNLAGLVESINEWKDVAKTDIGKYACIHMGAVSAVLVNSDSKKELLQELQRFNDEHERARTERDERSQITATINSIFSSLEEMKMRQSSVYTLMQDSIKYQDNCNQRITKIYELLMSQHELRKEISRLKATLNTTKIQEIRKIIEEWKTAASKSAKVVSDHNPPCKVTLAGPSKRLKESSIVAFTRLGGGGEEELCGNVSDEPTQVDTYETFDNCDYNDHHDLHRKSKKRRRRHDEHPRTPKPIMRPTFCCYWGFSRTKGCGEQFYSLAALRSHKKKVPLKHFSFNGNLAQKINYKDRQYECPQSLVRRQPVKPGSRVKSLVCPGLKDGGKDRNCRMVHARDLIHAEDFTLNHLHCYVCKKTYTTEPKFMSHFSRKNGFKCMTKEVVFEVDSGLNDEASSQGNKINSQTVDECLSTLVDIQKEVESGDHDGICARLTELFRKLRTLLTK